MKEFAVEEKDESKPAEKERIVKDLKQMSQKEKMKLLKKESPELLELIQDFKAKVKTTSDVISRCLFSTDKCLIDVNFLCYYATSAARWTEGWAAAPRTDGQGWKDPTRKGECI